LILDFTGVKNTRRQVTAPGSGIWTFDNRLSVTYASIEIIKHSGPGQAQQSASIQSGAADHRQLGFVPSLKPLDERLNPSPPDLVSLTHSLHPPLDKASSCGRSQNKPPSRRVVRIHPGTLFSSGGAGLGAEPMTG